VLKWILKAPTVAPQSAGPRAKSLPTALRVCPICTLQRAGISRSIRGTFSGTVGDIDQRILGNWASAGDAEQDSLNIVDYHKSSALLVRLRRPPATTTFRAKTVLPPGNQIHRSIAATIAIHNRRLGTCATVTAPVARLQKNQAKTDFRVGIRARSRPLRDPANRSRVWPSL
jgi:hypothetical protein